MEQGNDVFARIDGLLKSRGRVVIAIDGQSGAGKTTLAGLLADRYGARVLHGDDYFPRPGHRHDPGQLAGVNLDVARFLQEIIHPLEEDRDIYTRPFDCKNNRLLPPRHIPFLPVSILEGSYCLHPSFGPYYDVAIFLQVDPAVQRARLQARYDAPRLQRATEEWIPMENAYFSSLNIPEKCDFILTMA